MMTPLDLDQETKLLEQVCQKSPCSRETVHRVHVLVESSLMATDAKRQIVLVVGYRVVAALGQKLAEF